MMPAALYVRSDTVYRTLGCDCWSVERDARVYQGPRPVIAHPPCAGWGRYRMKRRSLWEKHSWTIEDITRDAAAVMCGPIAIEQVCKYGGVLEHPAYSLLFKYAHVPQPGDELDEHGGFTIRVEQSWWGHRCRKPTWLYIVGVSPWSVHLPDPVEPTEPGVTIQHLSKREREATPIGFASWLVELASRCKSNTTPAPFEPQGVLA